MKYIVSYSGGLGSFMSAYETVKKHGKENVVLVFTDTKTEDEDLYRFLSETAKALELTLVTLADGRNIWEVFRDVKFHGNNRIDPCSRILKRELFKKWMEKNYQANEATLVVGISKDEAHRLDRISQHWAPYKVDAPLCELNRSREDILDVLDKLKVEPPRLYEWGFAHNNCGGFCVKTGQKQMKLLLEKNPERYRWHEEQQEKLFSIIGKRHGFIRKTDNGELKYLTLKEFRESMEAGEQPDLFVENGCGCFV